MDEEKKLAMRTRGPEKARDFDRQRAAGDYRGRGEVAVPHKG
jgi:hypothetical protein